MVNHYLTPGAIIDSSHTWDETQTFADSTALAFGTGSDSKISFNGIDTYWDLQATGAGGLMIALEDSPPAPDNNTVHIWAGDATRSGGGVSVTAESGNSLLVLENNGQAHISILTNDEDAGGMWIATTDGNRRAGLIHQWDTVNMWSFLVEGATRLKLSDNTFEFQQGTTISTESDALTLDPATNVHITNNKGLVVGHTAQIAFNDGLANSVIPEIQALGTGIADGSLGIAVFHTGNTQSTAPVFSMLKSAQGTIGSTGIVADDEVLGTIIWNGDDGADYLSAAASIMGVVDGSTASNVMPGRLVFLTTADDAGQPAERWRITTVGSLTSLAAAPANAATTDGGIIATGGIAFTDVANAWIDDATHGSGTVTHYIGDETIDTTSSYRAAKENIVPVNGSGRRHLEALSGLVAEYDYRSGTGHFVGLIAEDVQEVMPQYVIGADAPSLRYQYMVGPLLWGWGDHDERIAALEAQVVALSGI